jgi:hypothetical protein
MVLLSAHVVLATALLLVGVGHVLVTGLATRAADVTGLRRLLRPAGVLAMLSPIIAVLTVLTGLVLTALYGRFDDDWIVATLVLVVVLGVNAPVVQRRPLTNFEHALDAAATGPVPATLRVLAENVPMRVGQRMVPWLHIGVFFLMLEQPAATGSLLTLLVLGIVAAVLVVLQRRRLVAARDQLPAATTQELGASSPSAG